MRITSLLCALLWACTIASAEEVSIDAQVSFYQKTVLKSPSEVARCARLLRAMLSNGTYEEADTVMRKEGCFDDFSGLMDAPFINRGVATVPPGPTVMIRVIGDVLIVRITTFVLQSGAELHKLVTALPPQQVANVKYVVVDLVGDLGGSILGLRDALGSFAPAQGAKYMHVESRCGDIKPVQTALERGVLADKRYVILVDNYTASASEWFTGILRYEWYPKQTIVVGVNADRTYGKGIMQYIDPGLRMKVTCGSWTVNGRSIQGIGIKADKVVQIPKPCGKDKVCRLAHRGLNAIVTADKK